MKLLNLLKNRSIARNILLVVMLIIGIIISLTISLRIETFFLVAFLLSTASKSIAKLLSLGLVWPLLLLIVKIGLERPGSKNWDRMIARICSIIPLLVSGVSLYHLLEFDYFLILFTSIHFLKYQILVWDWDPRGFEQVSFFLFLNVPNMWGRDKKIKDVWIRAILPFMIVILWVSGVVYSKLSNENFSLTILIGVLSLSLFTRVFLDLFNYLKSLNLKDNSIEIFFYEGSLFFLIVLTLLISLNVQNIGIWFLFSIVLVGDFIIMQTELFRIPTFGSVYDFQSLKPHFFSNHQFSFIPLFYFLIPISALILDKVSVLILFSVAI